MKIYFGIILFAIILLMSGCNKDELIDLPQAIEFDFSGEIVGFDLALCACCGGYVTNITGSDSEFRIQEIPLDFQSILDTTEFPLNVNLNFTEIDPCTSYRFINVDEIEIVE